MGFSLQPRQASALNLMEFLLIYLIQHAKHITFVQMVSRISTIVHLEPFLTQVCLFVIMNHWLSVEMEPLFHHPLDLDLVSEQLLQSKQIKSDDNGEASLRNIERQASIKEKSW